MTKEKIKPRIVKARKDYVCLTCCKEIPKGTSYLLYPYLSSYLCEAWREVTKFEPWVKVFEGIISLRFCSGRCFRRFLRLSKEGFKGSEDLRKRYMTLVISTRDRRLKGWTAWRIWHEIFKPLDKKWRIN